MNKKKSQQERGAIVLADEGKKPGSVKKKKDGTGGPVPATKKKKPRKPAEEPENAGAMVAYDEEANRSRSASKRKPRGRDVDSDVSGVSGDDDEYDPNDEPRFKYSTAELDESSCRNSKCCLITVAIICLIVFIALSIVMARVFKAKDEENQAPPPTFAPTTAAQAGQPGIGMFRLSRQVVEEERCPIGRANSDACRNTCQGFECCDPTLAENCFFYNQEGCMSHKRCHVQSSGIVVPPLNLATICSPNGIARDRQPCAEACAVVACCWQSDVTCYDKFYSCLDYAPCQNLREDALVPAATREVERFCDVTQTGSLTQAGACEDACSPAACCWSEEADNCLQTDFIACMTYEPCKKLELPPAGGALNLPPASIRSDCSIARINSGNTADCEQSCRPSECCAPGHELRCFELDPLSCLAFEPCAALST